MSRAQRMAALAVLLTLVSGVVAALTLLVADRDGDQGDQPRDLGAVVAGANLTPQGAELVGLLQRGRQVTYHARYRSVSSEEGLEPGESTLSVWRRAALVRQDTETAAPGGVNRTAAFFLPSGLVSCAQAAGAAWSCQRLGEGDPAGADSLVSQVAARVGGRLVEARDDTVAGRAARCFTIFVGNETSDVCTTREGVPLRIAAGAASFELVELTADVPEQAFRPPAQPA